MKTIVVEPGAPLRGSVRVGGAKNSVLKLMAACLLAEGTHRITNVPAISDVDTMAEVLEALGCGVSKPEPGALEISVPAREQISPEAPYELVERFRASIVVLGPLLARCGKARMSLPGGDDFGSRPIDFHLEGLATMGAVFTAEHGWVDGAVKTSNQRLKGGHLVLEYPSHTATDNLVMAAVLADGTTVIDNAAKEPEVEDLATMLNEMGARIEGIGTSRLTIHGVDALAPADHVVISDRVVAATYLLAPALAGGEVRVEDAHGEHMETFLIKLRQMGMEVDESGPGIAAARSRRLTAVDIATLPYPGVATDYKPFLVAALCVAEGVSIVSENLFEGRFRYIEELRRMGADVRTEGHHAVIRGVERLSGAMVKAPDIRAGAALVLAGLAADGETHIAGAEHIERGYEDLVGNLSRLGATVAWR